MSDATAPDTSKNEGAKGLRLSWMVLGVGPLAIAAVLAWMLWLIVFSAATAEIKLPLVVIFSVVMLVIVLGLLTFGFSRLGLASSGQALGLPDGSVRAVIAIMLLVLFAIVAIFLYNSVATATQSISNVPAEQLENLRKQVAVILTLPDTGKDAKGTFTVYYRNSNPASDDIAKQLITLLGTLVTAVASFYFGANSVASAHEANLKAGGGPSGPTVTGLAPSSSKKGSGAQPIRIAGSNLSNVKSVTFVKDGTILDTALGNASATEITCTITIKADADPGKYDLVLSDGAKEVARKQQAFEITP